MKTRKWFLLLLPLLIIVSGCYRRGAVLEFVVPDGYTGILKLRESPSGIVIRPTNGVIELHFSADGVCEVKGELPTRNWHTKNPRYATAGPITSISFPDKVPKNAVGLRSVGSKSISEDWFVIGTYSDVAAALEKMVGFKWPSQ